MIGKFSIKTYTITYNLDGGTNADSNPTTYTIESDDITLAAPTKDGYTFTGWTYDGQLTPKTSVTIAKGSTGNLTYTANWEAISYTVTFDVQGHGTAPTAQTVNSGDKVTKPKDPTAECYEFIGWYKEAACSTAWNFDTDVVTAATTLYAKWSYVPFQGQFVTIQNVSSSSYISSAVDASSNKLKLTSTSTADNIFYCDGKHLISYATGWRVKNEANSIGANDAHLSDTPEDGSEETQLTYTADGDKYYIQDNKGNYYTATGSKVYNNPSKPQSINQAKWTITPVTALPLTVGSNGLTTFSAPVPTTIPSGYEAWIATTHDDAQVHFTSIGQSIPANTGVVITGGNKGDTFNATVASSAPDINATNLLKEAFEKKSLIPNTTIWLLATVYRHLETDGDSYAFGGHKSYFDAPASSSAKSMTICFDDNTITAINAISDKAENSAIYDLQGRRVVTPVKGSIYIKNGQKFMVK